MVTVTIGTALAAVAPVGERRDVPLDRHSPLAEQHEFIRRALTPTTSDRMFRFEKEVGPPLVPHPMILKDERLDAYIPKEMPPDGYGVIVFVPPANEWPVPRDYRKVLDQRGLIWVAARRSGNAQDVYDRRMPLALHALDWVERHYPVNRDRRYISGFSGGGRVAQRIALAYPDVFSGALLIAGSDAFDDNGTVVPPRELFERFRANTRVVYATGMQDPANRTRDELARTSMRRFCVNQLFRHVQSRTGHWIPNGRGFARALVDLDSPRSPSGDNPTCSERLDAEVTAALAQVDALITAGNNDAAGNLLFEIDERYGGLAAPRSVDLARQLAR